MYRWGWFPFQAFFQGACFGTCWSHAECLQRTRFSPLFSLCTCLLPYIHFSVPCMPCYYGTVTLYNKQHSCLTFFTFYLRKMWENILQKTHFPLNPRNQCRCLQTMSHFFSHVMLQDADSNARHVMSSTKLMQSQQTPRSSPSLWSYCSTGQCYWNGITQ